MSNVRKIEPLVSFSSPFEVEIDITKLKKYKSPGSDQISTEHIQEEGKLLSYADDVNLLEHNIDTMKENTET
jgi:hypothetical protein